MQICLFFLTALLFQDFELLPGLLISSAELALMAREHAERLRIRDFGVGTVLNVEWVGLGTERFTVFLERLVEKRGFHGLDAAEPPTS